MASNRIPENIAPLLHLAQDAADGAAQQGAAVGLLQNTAEKIRAGILALVGDPGATPPVPGRQVELDRAAAVRSAASAAERSVTSDARAFLGSAIGLLKIFLGRQWNPQWAEAGFAAHSLAVPDDPVPALQQLAAYFGNHAAQENAALAISAATCTAQIERVARARAASNLARAAFFTARAVRDAAWDDVYRRMTGLRVELELLLEDDDARWYAFGFDRPADGEQPGAVAGLVLTAGGAGSVIADWREARRAERYHVCWKVAGSEEEPVAADGASHDTERMLTGLPSGQEVVVSVAGVNDAGEGPATASEPFRVP